MQTGRVRTHPIRTPPAYGLDSGINTVTISCFLEVYSITPALQLKVFSMLENSFSKQQTQSIEDYVSLSVMLYNR